MTTIQQIDPQDDFAAGMNRDSAPHLIPDNAVYDLVDLVLDDDGSAYRRGGTKQFSFNKTDARGTFLFDGMIAPGRRTIVADTGGVYVLDADDETLVKIDTVGMSHARQSAVMDGLLFAGGGMVTAGARSDATDSVTVTVTNGSKVVTRSGGSWSGVLVPGHLMRIGTDRVYVVASVDSATQLTLRSEYQEGSGSKVALFKPVIWSSDVYGPEAYVAVCMNRLVYAEGQTIRFSGIGDPHSFATNDFHELPIGSLICGLADLGGTLLVFTTDGIWTIDGLAFNIVDANGNGQHSVKRLSSDIALAGAAGIAGWSQQLVVPASDGIWLLDGVSTPTRISRGVERPYKAWLKWGARLGQATVYRGHYLLPVVSPSGSVKEMFVCRIDRPVKGRWRDQAWPWSRFQGDGACAALVVRHGAQQLSPALLGLQPTATAKITDCSEFFNPDSSVRVDADGVPPVPQLVTRDFGSGSGTVNSVRAVGLRYELRGANGAVKVEWSEGGPSYDVAGASEGFRVWGDPDGLWFDADGIWGEGFGPLIPDTTAPGSGPVWVELSNPPAESDGIKRIKCRVNKRTRYSRFRLTCNGDVEGFRIRSLELFTRPSQAVRI